MLGSSVVVPFFMNAYLHLSGAADIWLGLADQALISGFRADLRVRLFNWFVVGVGARLGGFGFTFGIERSVPAGRASGAPFNH